MERKEQGYFYNLKEKMSDAEYLKSLRKRGIRYVKVGDQEYPEKLMPFEHKPEYLFYKGRLPDAGKPTVAMVGARAVPIMAETLQRIL